MFSSLFLHSIIIILQQVKETGESTSTAHLVLSPHPHLYTPSLRRSVSGFGTQAAQQDLWVHLVYWSCHVIGWGARPNLLVCVLNGWWAAEPWSISDGSDSVGGGRVVIWRPEGPKFLYLWDRRRDQVSLSPLKLNKTSVLIGAERSGSVFSPESGSKVHWSYKKHLM